MYFCTAIQIQCVEHSLELRESYCIIKWHGPEQMRTFDIGSDI